MKGDFSRLPARSDRSFDRVLMQQGRLQTDFDWNEQSAAEAERHLRAVRDLIGPQGAPADRAGFAIRAHFGLLFDGQNSWVEITAPTPQSVGSAFSIDGWVKISTPARRATLIGRGASAPGAQDSFQLFLSADNRLNFETAGRITTTVQPLTLETFVHLAVTREPQRIRIFVNGRLDCEQSAGEGPAFNTSGLSIGCDRSGGAPASLFAGTIDQLRLWGSALSIEDIGRFALGDTESAGSELLCDWRFGSKADPLIDVGGAAQHGQTADADAGNQPGADPVISISPGCYYVQGVASEISRALRFDSQPTLPGVRLPDKAARTAYPGPYLFYLDSWDRLVTAYEDPSIGDTALGGLDTSVRVEVVSQARMVKGGTIEAAETALESTGALKMSRGAQAQASENRLLRVEIHDAGLAAGAPAPPTGASPDGLPISAVSGDWITLAEGEGVSWRSGGWVELVKAGLAKPLLRQIRAAEVDDKGHWKLELATTDSQLDLETDVGQWWVRPIASFKWSADNGSWLLPITDVNLNGPTVNVADPAGRKGLLDDWTCVELIDEASVLLGQPGIMAMGRSNGDAGYGDLQIDLEISGGKFGALSRAGPQLRLWEQIGRRATPVGLAPVSAGLSVALGAPGVWVELEFSSGRYVTGDYWTLASRAGMAWPDTFRPRENADHRLAPLASVVFRDDAVEVTDLRSVFAPLAQRIDDTARTADAVAPASADAPGNLLGDTSSVEDLGAIRANVSVYPRNERVLTTSRRPTAGWRFEDARVAVPVDEPSWAPAQIPVAPEALQSAVELGGEVFGFTTGCRLYRLTEGLEAWQRRRAPPEDFVFSAMTACAGRLHVLGSRRNGLGALHFIYNAQTDTWIRAAALAAPRARLGLAALGGCLWAAGGVRRNIPRLLDLVEVYDPQRDAWASSAPLPYGVADGALVAAQGRLYLFGGVIARTPGGPQLVTARVSVFSPSGGTWSEGRALAAPRSGALLAVTTRRFHVLGGTGAAAGPLPDEMLDVAAGAWLEAPQPPQARSDQAVVALDGAVYRFGAPRGGSEDAQVCRFEQTLFVHSRAPTPESPIASSTTQ